MTSSMHLKQFGLVIVLIALSACGDFLKGKPKKDTLIEIKQESLVCLKNVVLDVKKFMKSESTDADIEKTFACIDNTLKEFQSRVVGRELADSFNEDELYEMFNQFIKDAAISKTATGDLLMLKSAVLGGSEDKITKSEITNLRQYLLILKEECKNLKPYAKLFTFKKAEVAFSKIMIRNGFAQLNLSLKNLLNASKLAHSSYQYSDLKNLISNINIISEDQKNIFSFAEKINNLLVGNENLGSLEDKLLYIDNLTEVLRLHSIQTQGYISFKISNATNMNEALEYVQAVVELAENSVQYKKSKLISYETIDPLLSELVKLEIMPVRLSQETALSFYKTLLVRVFESGLSGDVLGFSGIKKIHFENIKRELAIYRLYNRYIEIASGSFAGEDEESRRIPVSELRHILINFSASTQKDILQNFNSEMQLQIIEGFEELKKEFLTLKPVIYRFNKVVLAANQEAWDQNWQDLSRALYVAMLSRELLLGWGQSPLVKSVKSAFVNEQGLVQWYSEFKSFGIEVKTFDPRSKNSGASNLLSANLFTRAGNGDDKMNFRESIQFLGILFSGGGKVADEMSNGFQKANCNLPELDVFSRNFNNEACAIEDLRRNYKYYFSNLSYLVAYLDKISANESEFKEFYNSVMSIARVSWVAGKRVETADIRSFSTLLHYIESIFSTYDLNKNNLLSEDEIKATYPKFKIFAEKFAHKSSQEQLAKFNSWMGVAAGYSCYSEQDLIKEAFVFMVYNGKTPTTSDLSVLPCLRNEPLIKFKGEVDRKNIINTFKIIKSILG